MNYDPERHHRRSIRLKGYDYSSKGLYYVTLCVNDRLCLFGNAVNSEMRLNDAGEMVSRIWREILKYYIGSDIDEHTIMPNHLHGIILLDHTLVGAPPCGRPSLRTEERAGTGAY